MTQTQDEQNVQASGVQAQGTNPVADDQNVQTTAPDLSAVDLTSETPTEPAAEQPVSSAEPIAEQPKEESVLQQWANAVKNTVHSGVDKVKEIWKEWVEQIKDSGKEFAESTKSVVQLYYYQAHLLAYLKIVETQLHCLFYKTLCMELLFILV